MRYTFVVYCFFSFCSLYCQNENHYNRFRLRDRTTKCKLSNGGYGGGGRHRQWNRTLSINKLLYTRNESLNFWLLHYKLGISTIRLSFPLSSSLSLSTLSLQAIQKRKSMNLHNLQNVINSFLSLYSWNYIKFSRLFFLAMNQRRKS